jgi:hypothetical protein
MDYVGMSAVKKDPAESERLVRCGSEKIIAHSAKVPHRFFLIENRNQLLVQLPNSFKNSLPGATLIS